MVKAKIKVTQGIIVVRKDASINSVDELANTRLAFAGPDIFAAIILPKALLNASHIAFNKQYVFLHYSVYKSVANRLFITGGGVIRTFNALEQEVRDKLRTLWTSVKYIPHAIAMSSPSYALVLKQALSELDQDDHGRTILARLKLNDFETAINTYWNDIRVLQIDLHLSRNREF